MLFVCVQPSQLAAMYGVLFIAALLVVASGASVKSAKNELSELIDEVRSYLDGRHEKKVSARLSAYDDVQTFYTRK